MRVALVGPTHPYKGGVAQHTTCLAHQLRRRGHDVRIVSWHRQYPQRLYPGQQFVEAPELPPFEPTERILSWNRPDTWLRAGRRLRSADLVAFAHVTPIQAPIYRSMITALGRGPTETVIICHNVLPHERRRSDQMLVRGLLARADRVLVHSESEASLARSLADRSVRVAPMAPFMPEGFAPYQSAAG